MNIIEGIARDIIGNLTKLDEGAKRIEHVLSRNTEILIGGAGVSLIILLVQFGMIIYLYKKQKEKKKDELLLNYP